ncbi:MAG TPA: hypothetical protein VM600_02215 [Actinomycetota bacterium]|nr:hypothetical protein [Actinomycetota bacterium]
MPTRVFLALILTLAALVAAPAAAHDDQSPDAQRCDTWYRQGHTATPTSKDDHHHASSSDIALNDPAGTVIHAHSGHYVLRNRYGYVTVVGGGSYRGPGPDGSPFPGQGGFVQGEVDPGSGLPDADFNVAAFGPDADHPPTGGDVAGWARASYARGCVDAAGTRAEHESRKP